MKPSTLIHAFCRMTMTLLTSNDDRDRYFMLVHYAYYTVHGVHSNWCHMCLYVTKCQTQNGRYMNSAHIHEHKKKDVKCLCVS